MIDINEYKKLLNSIQLELNIMWMNSVTSSAHPARRLEKQLKMSYTKVASNGKVINAIYAGKNPSVPNQMSQYIRRFSDEPTGIPFFWSGENDGGGNVQNMYCEGALSDSPNFTFFFISSNDAEGNDVVTEMTTWEGLAVTFTDSTNPLNFINAIDFLYVADGGGPGVNLIGNNQGIDTLVWSIAPPPEGALIYIEETV